MSSFRYRVRNETGQLREGIVEARSDENAASLLREQGYFVIDIRPLSNQLSLFQLSPFKKISFSEIVNFTRQLSTMITAGLTLTEAVSLLRAQTHNPTFAKVLDDILHNIEAGESFASSLERYPSYFSKLYVSLIKASEAGGMLDKVLARLADNLEKEREFKGKIKSAMVYPVIILVGMVVVFFIVMTVVMPRMTSLYKEFGLSLPITTQFLITLSDFLVKFWWLVILGIIGLVVIFNKFRKTSLGERIMDEVIFRLPVFGNLKKETILVEFTRTLGLLVGAGLPIIEALNIVSDSLDSPSYREGIREAITRVEKGFPLGVPLSQNLRFPPILGQMVKVGEETGKLDEALLKLSYYFESESEQTIRGLTSAIEPLIMIVLGVGVGFLVLSIILPIYQLTQAF